MNRRSLIRSLVGVAAFVGFAPQVGTAATAGEPQSGHQCTDICFSDAENVARANIKETSGWKLQTHDWTKRRMVVTRCGQAACEVTLAHPTHHPYREYRCRSLTTEEKASFRAEYGRAHWLLRMSPDFEIRGFILNGRCDGWNISVRSAGPSGA